VLRPGDRVGRYEVIDRIGRDGMGIVFSARDPKLNRKVALKCPWPRPREEVVRERFRDGPLGESQRRFQRARRNGGSVTA
jgi:serine/threonine protein kinase